MALIINPDVEIKQAELRKLKNEYLSLYSLHDEMTHVEYNSLIIEYIKLIGERKYDNYALEVEVRSLKMKCEMAMSYINRDKPVDIEGIQKEVEQRLAEYYNTIAQQTAAVKSANEAIIIPKSDMEEMKRLHRILVKRLHPDIHPEQSEEDKDLFTIGLAAYRNYNLEKLRDIVLKLDLEESDKVMQPESEGIDDVIERLKLQIEHLKQETDMLKSVFPFNVKDEIRDSEWVRLEQERLSQEKEFLLEQKKTYTERYNLIIGL